MPPPGVRDRRRVAARRGSEAGRGSGPVTSASEGYATRPASGPPQPTGAHTIGAGRPTWNRPWRGNAELAGLRYTSTGHGEGSPTCLAVSRRRRSIKPAPPTSNDYTIRPSAICKSLVTAVQLDVLTTVSPEPGRRQVTGYGSAPVSNGQRLGRAFEPAVSRRTGRGARAHPFGHRRPAVSRTVLCRPTSNRAAWNPPATQFRPARALYLGHPPGESLSRLGNDCPAAAESNQDDGPRGKAAGVCWESSVTKPWTPPAVSASRSARKDRAQVSSAWRFSASYV